MSNLQIAPTQYVDTVNGITFAYRCLGSDHGVPLVLHIHFRANMDFWDPLFVNTLAIARRVIIFDQAGIGRSTGTVPTTFQGWADDLIAFVNALGIPLIDLFGFSLGGVCVQVVALTQPSLIRKLILAGTTASKPLNIASGVVWPREIAPSEPIRKLASAISIEEGRDAIAFSFFPDNDVGREDFDQYWRRIHERKVEPLNLNLLDRYEGGRNQRAASLRKDQSDSETWFHKLQDLDMPVLVANGDDDVLIPTSRSWELTMQIQNAWLIIYPQAGHGFLWQYAEQFAGDINRFLDRDTGMTSRSKL